MKDSQHQAVSLAVESPTAPCLELCRSCLLLYWLVSLVHSLYSRHTTSASVSEQGSHKKTATSIKQMFFTTKWSYDLGLSIDVLYEARFLYPLQIGARNADRPPKGTEHTTYCVHNDANQISLKATGIC